MPGGDTKQTVNTNTTVNTTVNNTNNNTNNVDVNVDFSPVLDMLSGQSEVGAGEGSGSGVQSHGTPVYHPHVAPSGEFESNGHIYEHTPAGDVLVR